MTWTDEEDAILDAEYPLGGAKLVFKTLGGRHSYNAVKERARQRGVRYKGAGRGGRRQHYRPSEAEIERMKAELREANDRSIQERRQPTPVERVFKVSGLKR